MFRSPSGVSVAMSVSRVEPCGIPWRCSSRSSAWAIPRTSPACRGFGTTLPSGRATIVSSRSARPSGPQIGFILTQRSRPPNSRWLSQSLTTGRVAAFRSGGTASSRSRISPSAGSASAFRSIFSLPPARSGASAAGASGTPLAHHRVPARQHDDVAVLVLRPVLEGDDAPLRTRPRLALVHHLGLRVDRIAVEDGLRELDLLEAEVAHRRPEGRLADREPHRDPERQDAVDSGLPNSAFDAAWKSRWSGCGFIVRQVKKTLSASVIVRPGWWRNVCPTSSSSKNFPAIPSSSVSRWYNILHHDGIRVRNPHAGDDP